MYDKKLIWLGSLVTVGIVTSNSVVAQTNQSDTSGGQTFSAPTVQIDNKNGNGIPPTTQFNPTTGEVVGGGISNPVELQGASGQNVGCSGDACVEGNANQPREVTLNQVAEVLDASLERSLDNLAAAENKARLADAQPRRIARRSAVSEDKGVCINPVFEAREILKKQLMETEKFIEQVDRIEPQKNIW